MFNSLFCSPLSINNLVSFVKTVNRKFASNVIPNYYAVLGLEPRASQKKIKEAYQKLVKEYHPDKNSEHSGKIYDINAAYELLSNEAEKLKYDETLFFDEKPKREFSDFMYENTEYYDPTFSADRIFRKRGQHFDQYHGNSQRGDIKRKNRHMTQKYEFHKNSGSKVFASHVSKFK